MTSQRTRDRLVERLRAAGIRDQRVLAALGRVPRHLFVDEALATRAYEDTALPIGYGQTLSQPLVVAAMTQALLAGESPQRVLEVGTGSGYQSAVLGLVAERVYTVERIEPLLTSARRRLRQLGYANVWFQLADGAIGWTDHAPYDAILVTAAPDAVPEDLLHQLRPGGRLVLPLGDDQTQELVRITRSASGLVSERLGPVNFVPFCRGVV